MIKRSKFWISTATICIGMAVATSSFISRTPELSNPPAQEENVRVTTGHPKMAVDFRAIAKKAVPAVVSIKVQAKRGSSFFESDDAESLEDFWGFFGIPRSNMPSRPQAFTGQASGVLVSPEGHILTNSHVVTDMDQILIQLYDGREFRAKVLGNDSNSDLALIKIEAEDLPYLKLGNSDDVEVGEWVAAIGNPLGLQATLTVGVVSAKSRNNLNLTRSDDFIQTDAAIYKGNSGGALITLNGELIGINTAIATSYGSGYMGIGFAIPSNIARHVMEDILTKGRVLRGFLGVTLQSINYDLAQAYNLKKIEGALVTGVQKNSPAEKAGLRTEDIILKVNGRSVDNAAALRNAVYLMHPGTRAVLTVLRQDQVMEVPVEIGDLSDETVATSSSSSKNNQLGVEVEPLSPDMAQSLGYSNDRGVIITRVNPNSIASLVGLKKGTLIMAVNRQKVSTVDEFFDALSQTPAGRPVLLQIKQGGQVAFLSLQVQNNLK